MLLCDSDTIVVADLPENIAVARYPDGMPTRRYPGGLGGEGKYPAEWWNLPIREARQEVVAQFERAYLARILEETRGRVGESAIKAGIEPLSLYEKMREYGLRKEDFRPRRR